MLLVEQSLVAGRTINLVEHSIQPMTKPNSNNERQILGFCSSARLSVRVHGAWARGARKGSLAFYVGFGGSSLKAANHSSMTAKHGHKQQVIDVQACPAFLGN